MTGFIAAILCSFVCKSQIELIFIILSLHNIFSFLMQPYDSYVFIVIFILFYNSLLVLEIQVAKPFLRL